MSIPRPEEIVKNALVSYSSRLRRQHELAVSFGAMALRMDDIDSILAEASRRVAQGVNSRFAKVLRYQAECGNLLLVAGVGWSPQEVGHVTLRADDSSPAGYAFLGGAPVLSNHLGDEHRFRTPEILARHGVRRAINVPIRSAAGAFGVLEADSVDDENFIETDIVFLESIANVIAISRERILADRDARRDALFSASVLDASTDCIEVLSVDGAVDFVNQAGRRELGLGADAPIDGPWIASWPEDEVQTLEDAMRVVRTGDTMRFEAHRLDGAGRTRWYDVLLAPIVAPDEGPVRQMVSLARDITDRRKNELALNCLLAEQENRLDSTELLMKEVHHRVRNSLQLVETLLSLQGAVSPEPTVKSQLRAAAARVSTIGLVHQRLYQDNGSKASDAGDYLRELVNDLQASTPDRVLHLEAPSVVIPAPRLAPLGLITVELVTNALKYGKGAIRVTLSEAPGELLLVVEDEGPGFPIDFPTPQGTGLGMRLIRSYSGLGAAAVSIDRDAPHGRISVRFRIA